MTGPLEPEDVVVAANHVVSALAPALDDDWRVPVSGLDWDVRTVLLHSAASVTYYAAHLASQSPARLPLVVDVTVDATNEQILKLLPATARVLTIVAEAAPASARAFHEGGMADASGFVAMAIDEVVVHGADAATGLGLSFDPPEQLARKVVDRLFPWAPVDTDAWTALLWANGRLALPGQPRIRPNWSWQCAPLDEWEGDIRFHRRLPNSYTWDPDTRRWRAVE